MLNGNLNFNDVIGTGLTWLLLSPILKWMNDFIDFICGVQTEAVTFLAEKFRNCCRKLYLGISKRQWKRLFN